MSVAEKNRKLDELIMSGKAMEGFEEFYADDVVMQENTEAPFVGKDFNRKRELEFFTMIEAWHSGKVLSSGAGDDVSFSETEADMTLKGMGRITMVQVAVRRWKNGKIVHERFYHK